MHGLAADAAKKSPALVSQLLNGVRSSNAPDFTLLLLPREPRGYGRVRHTLASRLPGRGPMQLELLRVRSAVGFLLRLSAEFAGVTSDVQRAT